MEKNVNSIFKKYDLSEKKVVLAVSGGVDSVVMLDLAAKYLPKERVVIAHVNHGIRLESKKEEKFVRDLAKKYGLSIEVKKLKLGKASEEVARKLRYQFLRKVKAKHKADFILTAHHKNDQAETIILQLVRGTGPIITGIKEQNDSILRPLLELSKKQIFEYATKKKLKFVNDKSNKNTDYSRNRVRNLLIPELEKINPGLIDTIASNAKLGQELEKYIDQEVTKAASKVHSKDKIDTAKLLSEPKFIQNLVAKKFLETQKRTKEGIYQKNVKSLLSLVNKNAGKKLELFGFTLVNDYGKISLDVRPNAPKPVNLRLGERVNFGGFKIVANQKAATAQKNNILLPLKFSYNLRIRTYRIGDRITTKSGTKKISDVFTDAKIPQNKRKIWPIVVSGKEILWVPMLQASKYAKTSSKNKTLTIEVKIEKQ